MEVSGDLPGPGRLPSLNNYVLIGEVGEVSVSLSSGYRGRRHSSDWSMPENFGGFGLRKCISAAKQRRQHKAARAQKPNRRKALRREGAFPLTPETAVQKARKRRPLRRGDGAGPPGGVKFCCGPPSRPSSPALLSK